MDRISPLPDEILEHILSFLSTKQAASTSILSKRWRNVFALVPCLDLVYGNPIHRYHNPRYFMDFVESLLSLQGNSPIKKLTLEIHQFGIDPKIVQNWLCSVLERGLEDLNLFIYREEYQLWPMLIFKNNTLVKLRLKCGYEINLSQDVYLPKLRILRLESVDFYGVNNDVFETLLPRCPVLEELVVEDQRCVQWPGSVSSQSLKKLIIRVYNIPIISLDVPNLVYLELSCIFGGMYANANLDFLVEARLNLCGKLNRLRKLRRGASYSKPADMVDLHIGFKNVMVLHLSGYVLEMLYFSGQELPMFDNLLRLSISSDKQHGWQILPLLIKNCPNLETLIFKGLEHYITTGCGDACVCSGSKENTSSCLSLSRVKVLEVWDYLGTLRELNQMKHFLKKLQCLEMVKIRAADNLQEPIDIQHLLTLPRASSNCKIQAIS